MAYNRYTMQQKWVNNEPQDEYRQGSLIDQTEYDTMSECNEGNQNPDVGIEGKIYEWRQTSSVMCYNYSKYYVEEKYVSNDNGATFVPTGETRRGQLIEQNTQDCGYIEPQTRWTTVKNEYVCQGADKYTKEVQEVSYDGGETWNSNGQERGGTLIQRNSIDCGWVPAPQFRWVDDGYDCVGFDKYAQEKEQVSLDAGETWEDTGQTRLGEVIEYDSEDCGYTPPAPGAEDYLTFTALENGYFRFTGNDLQYSIDDGENWSTLTSGTDSPTIRANSRILWKATGLTPSQSSSPYGIGTFSSSVRFEVSGNVMSLYYGDDFASQTDLTGKDNAFDSLFYNCSNLASAENLVLPATTLSNSCYYRMFRGCTSLTTAPELPATTLAQSCYDTMFQNCTSLTTAPVLPSTILADYCYAYMLNGCTSLTTAPTLTATTLAKNCYAYMFSGCTNLVTVPSVLPATTLTNYCYYYMFAYCTSLETAPVLPAETLAENCYRYMFSGCRSLTTAPALPATTLATSCYEYMFNGCTSLSTAPELPATTLATSCYEDMFKGCSSLTTAPTLPATTLVTWCYQEMFKGCTNLNYVKAMFTTNPNVSDTIVSWKRRYTDSWLSGVASTGIFVKNSAATWTFTDSSGIPRNWTVQTASS